MAYKVVYTKTAEKDLEKIDTSFTIRILTKVAEFVSLDNPLVKAKKLQGFEITTYRYRIGDFRVIFRLDEKTNKLIVLVVLRVIHRKDVYKKM